MSEKIPEWVKKYHEHNKNKKLAKKSAKKYANEYIKNPKKFRKKK